MENKVLHQLIVVPAPGIGHLVPTIEFARTLTQRDNRISLTVLVMDDSPISPSTPSLHHFDSLITTDHLRLIQLPSLDPPSVTSVLTAQPGLPRIYLFVELYKPLIKDTVTRLVSPESSQTESIQLAGLILDVFTTTMIELADELGVPSYVYYTPCVAALGLMLHLPTMDAQMTTTELKSHSGELTIPSFSNSVPLLAFPTFMMHKEDNSYKLLLYFARNVRDVKGIIVNSFLELEPYAIGSFHRTSQIPKIYPVGPMIDRTGEVHHSEEAHFDHIMQWLDHQPRKSVIFLCFGSMGSLGPTQVKEIAIGLERSGHRFLWALRRPTQRVKPSDYTDLEGVVPDGFLERTAERGLICGWAPQVRVLAHEAIGCFVSHCGWNSTLESMWFGVPMLTWPLYAEQKLNAFELLRELGVAMEARAWSEKESEVTSAEEVERSVRSVMDGGEMEVMLRKRVDELRELSRNAVMDGGSSFVSMGRLIEDLICV